MKTTVISFVLCPFCGRIQAWVYSDDNGDFMEGDPSICNYCGEFFIFNEALQAEKPNDRQLEELKGCELVWAELTSIQEEIKTPEYQVSLAREERLRVLGDFDPRNDQSDRQFEK